MYRELLVCYKEEKSSFCHCLTCIVVLLFAFSNSSFVLIKWIITSHEMDLDLSYRNCLMMFKGLLLYLLKHQEKERRW